jgi:lipopolysaccharide export system protein LptA
VASPRRVLPQALLALTLLLAVPAAPTASAPPRTLELRASHVTVLDGGQVIEAQGAVRITDGRSVVRAERARYGVAARRIELTGAVVVEGPAGNLRADRALLLLDGDRRISSVEAAGAVTLSSGGRRLAADRVTVAMEGSSASASGNVRLRLPPDLAASGAHLTVQGGVAVLSGGAKVETSDGVIEGDRIEVSEREQVAFVRGNVRAVFDETRVTAGAATLYGGERRAVFRDDVSVLRPGRTLRAALVTVFLEDRRIVAEGETTIRIDEEGPNR